MRVGVQAHPVRIVGVQDLSIRGHGLYMRTQKGTYVANSLAWQNNALVRIG